jgi:hypothetical protein
VPSSGWRRPFTSCVLASNIYTVAVTKGEAIVIHTHWSCPTAYQRLDEECQQRKLGGLRPPAEGLCDGAAMTLQQPYHGREVHAAACLQLAEGVRAAVTVSEDGTLRCLLHRCAASIVRLLQCNGAFI